MSDNNALLSEVADAVVSGDEERARVSTKAALDAGVEPVKVMQVGVAEGMTVV